MGSVVVCGYDILRDRLIVSRGLCRRKVPTLRWEIREFVKTKEECEWLGVSE